MREYLLDTNAYFKILCYIAKKANNLSNAAEADLKKIITSPCHISQVTLIEIISVIGKTARGKSNSCDKCNRLVSPQKAVCQNNHYSFAQKGWSKKQIRAWIKLSNDITTGRSPIFSLATVPLDSCVFEEAEKIIPLSAQYSFASMDSIIAATAVCLINQGKNITVITSDKSLKAALNHAQIPYDDSIKEITYCP